MASPEQAIATQLANIEKRTGKTIAELTAIVQQSGLQKHGELVAMLKSTLGMGHGDANTIVHTAKKAVEAGAGGAAAAADGDPLDAIYVGAKAALRPIHEALLKKMAALGEFETAPKKSYVSYRRTKQFAMIGPATNTRVEVGLNVKGLAPTDRLAAMPAGKMCNYTVKLTDASQVDAELLGWIRAAYDGAG